MPAEGCDALLVRQRRRTSSVLPERPTRCPDDESDAARACPDRFRTVTEGLPTLTGIGAWLVHGLEGASLPALFACLTLETLGAPLPGESALIAAAAAAGAGKLPIWGVVGVAWLGSVLGDNIGFLIGRHIGRRAIISHGRRVGITEARYAKAEAIIARYGFAVVVIARFVVLLRQLNGLVAGSAGMPWKRFLFANIIGAALWVGFWAALAYHIGKAADVLPALGHHWMLIAAVLVPAVVGAGAAYVIWSRRKPG